MFSLIIEGIVFKFEAGASRVVMPDGRVARVGWSETMPPVPAFDSWIHAGPVPVALPVILALPGFFRLEHTLKGETHVWMVSASFEGGPVLVAGGDTAEAACAALLARKPA